MNHQPNTYGTGCDPEKKRSYRSLILLLLLSSAAIHALTFLYLKSREYRPDRQEPTLSLEELSKEHPQEVTIAQDCCGLGLQLSDLNEMQQRYWSLPDGVFVEQIEATSSAYAAGLRIGDLLLQIENRTVNDLEECLDAFEEFCGEADLELTYYRDGQQSSITIPLDCPGS